MIIGITGKSGSGKSTFASKLAKKINAYYIDLDSAFHDTIEQDIDFVVDLFGKNIIGPDGKPDRKKIGDLVFSNRNLYKEYSDRIYADTLSRVEQGIVYYKDQPCILDHILLPHMKELWSRCNLKILVDADWEIRRLRILSRDNISTEYLMKREAASPNYQPSDFDMVIKNDKSVHEESDWIHCEVRF